MQYHDGKMLGWTNRSIILAYATWNSFMGRSTHPRHFFTQEEAQKLKHAIHRVEQQTSAELKVLVVRHCWGRLHDKARRLFFKHGLDRTVNRNAVMILLVTSNREFLIYGDQGIHQHVGMDFWLGVRDAMTQHFQHDRILAGLEEAIGQIGSKLAKHFPAQAGNPNQLSDEVAHDH